jgi:seryl-tRNA(Sec) selenium transferase
VDVTQTISELVNVGKSVGVVVFVDDAVIFVVGAAVLTRSAFC